MSDTGSKTQTEEEKELLSQIIKKINEVFGVELKEEDRVCLNSISKELLKNNELDSIIRGNNSYDDKKDFFKVIFDDYMSDYTSDRIDFYKKVNNPKVLPMLIDGMFSEYMKHKNL
jgi:type I restriction enzyme R subunit